MTRPVKIDTTTSPPRLARLADTDPVELTGDTTIAGDLDVSGAITLTGNVDGRNVSADGSALDAHIAAASPHSGHEVTSAKGQANGYASLGSSGLVPIAQLASGTPTGAKFIRDDGVLATPPGGGGTGDVTGPASSTAQRVPRFSDTTGKVLEESPLAVDANGDATGLRHVAVSGNVDGRDVSADGAALDAHTAASDPHSGALPRSGARAMTGALDMGAQAITNVGNVDGRDVSADGTKLDGIAAGAAALTSSAAASIGTTGTVGVATTAARADHVHAHGAQTDSTLHAVATQSSAGFMSAADKINADAVPELSDILRASGVDAPEDEIASEVIGVIGNNRWRCGGSTEGFAQPHFYCEAEGDFADGGSCELYSPIGVPNATSTAGNWPAESDDATQASMYWDEGWIHIEPNQLVTGAQLNIELYGFMKVGRVGSLYVCIDPDGDVRVNYTGNNINAGQARQRVIGAVPHSAIGSPGTVSDDGSGNVKVTLVGHGLVDDDQVWVTSYDADLEDANAGIASDIVDGSYLYVEYIDDDNFRLSSTAVASPTYVAYNLQPGESDQVLITTYGGPGSWKCVRLKFELATLTTLSDWQPVRLNITAIADGSGSNDTEDGVTWYATLERFEIADQIGPTNDVAEAQEGGGIVVHTSANRTRPGTGYDGTSILPATAAPLIKAKTNYDGAGATAYYSRAMDFGGNWDEVELSAELTNTGSWPYASVLENYQTATITLLKVGSTYVGQVLEVLNSRLVVRYRPFSPETRIAYGDTVSWELYRKVSGSFGTTPHRTGSFTAGSVRLGPQRIELAVRCAMSGAQDATNQLDIRSGTATLRRHRSR